MTSELHPKDRHCILAEFKTVKVFLEILTSSLRKFDFSKTGQKLSKIRLNIVKNEPIRLIKQSRI